MFSLEVGDTVAIKRAIDNFKHLRPWVDLVSLTLSSELTIVRTPLQIHFQVVYTEAIRRLFCKAPISASIAQQRTRLSTTLPLTKFRTVRIFVQFQTRNGIFTSTTLDSGHQIQINHETNPTVMLTLPTAITYEVCHVEY